MASSTSRPPTDPSFVVVGVFDGLHLGHAYLLEHLVAEARRRHARPMVITFDHHPDEILTGSAPPLLCDPEERLERLAAAGVDATVVVHFDQHLRETTYGAFVDMIATRGPIGGFLMTPDAAFGYKRGGTPVTLAALGSTAGFEVVVVPPFELGGHPVRSTEVRAAIAAGDLSLAGRLLGRDHAVIGAAEPDGRGTVIRFPLPVALPPDGSWAAEITGNGAPAAVVAIVTEGSLRLPGTALVGRTRIAFRADGGAAGT